MATRRGREWWSYAQGMIRTFPAYGDGDLTPMEEREKAAVLKAIELTQQREDGAQRLELIRLAYWEKGGNVQKAATTMGIPFQTARKWSSDFTYATAYGRFGPGIIPHQQMESHHHRGR